MNCRHCNKQLDTVFADLATCPPSNAMVAHENLNQSESYFPLKVWVCNSCFLVQVDELEKAENIFNNEYTYFSSYSTSWLEHCKNYVELMIERFNFDSNSLVVEVASNDGYLLQYFQKEGIPVLGIEPTQNTADVAIAKGIDTIVSFFSKTFSQENLASKGKKADLLLGNNVLAHVPNINDFVAGMALGLKDDGVITMEFPHLLRLMDECQFDTIYHEHFSYLSLLSVQKIFKKQRLDIFDVDEIPTHGGSLRIYAQHEECTTRQIAPTVHSLITKEENFGLYDIDTYNDFQIRIDRVRDEFLTFLINCKSENKTVVGYGAAAKGNTLLNYCGIHGTSYIDFVVDRSPHKQNKYLPGSRIPVVSEEELTKIKPDYIIIFPWNLKTEIKSQLEYTRKWGAKFVTAIPKLTIH